MRLCFPPGGPTRHGSKEVFMTPAEELESAALALPAAERARLAERLLVSLDEEPEVDAAWVAEVWQRLAEYRTGEVETTTAKQVTEDARNRVRT